jgi:methyl-accepting chemotaxis protein
MISCVIAGLLVGLVSVTIGKVTIIKEIKKVKLALQEISEGDGDLNQVITIKSKDEIGDMAKYFNLTFDKIRTLITLVKEQSATLEDVGNNLSSSMTETSSAINEVTANIQSIKNQIMNQSASVTETSATMEQISKCIDKLNRLVEVQSINVTESSSAIEEMMANIGGVTLTLIRNTENINRLAE